MNLLFPVIPAILCFSVHELSHGLMALALGDDIARSEGRISLNPLRHIDPVGFLMLVVVGFGWAKPVRVNMFRFRNPKLGMALTAFAGPASNILLALVLMPLYGIFVALGYAFENMALYYAVKLVSTTVYLSLSLAVFNLIPFPPLDGSKIVEAVLPQRIYYQIMRFERYGMIVLFILLWSDVFDKYLSVAVDFLFENFLYIAQWAFEITQNFI